MNLKDTFCHVPLEITKILLGSVISMNTHSQAESANPSVASAVPAVIVEGQVNISEVLVEYALIYTHDVKACEAESCMAVAHILDTEPVFTFDPVCIFE